MRGQRAAAVLVGIRCTAPCEALCTSYLREQQQHAASAAALAAAEAARAQAESQAQQAQQLQQQEEHARDMWLVEHARRRYVEERWRHELEREEVRERQGQRMDTDATGAGTDAPLATEYSNS